MVIDDEDRRVLPKGSFFGEVSVLLEEPASASVVTRAPVSCLVVPGADVQDFLVSHPQVLYRILKAEARRLRDRVGVADLMEVEQEPYEAAGAARPGYLPIAEHGIIGDLHTAALVGTDGTIDWYCCPHFDSPSVFAAILDRKLGGYYRIAPATEGWTSKQLYFPDTNVLMTRFLTRGGRGRGAGLHADPRRARERVPAPAHPARARGPGGAHLPGRGGAALQLRARPAHDRVPRERRGVPLGGDLAWRWSRPRR